MQQIDDSWPIAFVPISIRYDTNRAAVFYQALAARLAAIVEQTLPPTPADPATFYKEKVVEYLDSFENSERRCLIVIDGLDEATGWHVDTVVLPPNLPRGLRIVASARQLAGDRGSRDWLRRLNWGAPRGDAKTIEVPPLTKSGIADVLTKMGFPLGQLAQDIDVVGELSRLTEGGDPLLLQLYVLDLWKRGDSASRLTAADLANLEPGFESYFRTWFEDQENAWREDGRPFDKDVVNALLALLACTIGSIELSALEPLVSRILGTQRIVTRDSIAPIGRFVIGDGVDIGFALAHPKLAEFLQADYFGNSPIVAKAKDAVVDWGHDIVQSLEAGKLQPKDTPRYCLLYHVQHLELRSDAVPPTYFRELVQDGWRKAWLAHEEGLRGFARDVEAVWHYLREASRRNPNMLREEQVGLGGLIRCVLCLSSIRSIGASVPPNLMAELVRQQLIGPKQALHFTRLKPDTEQATTFEALSPLLTSDLSEAIAYAREIRDHGARAVALASLARFVEEPARDLYREEALRTAGQATDYRQPEIIAKVQNYFEPEHHVETQFDVSPLELAQAYQAPVGSPKDSLFIQSDALAVGATVLMSEENARTEFQRALGDDYLWRRHDVLARLAPHLPDDLVEAALQEWVSAPGIPRTDMLAALFPRLTETQIDYVIDNALHVDAYRYLDPLKFLFPRLNARQIHDVLEHTFLLDGGARLRVLDALKTFVSDEDKERLVRVMGGWGPYYSKEGLKLLLPVLSSEAVGTAVDAVMSWPSYEQRHGLSVMWSRLNDEQRKQVFAATLEFDSFDRREALALIGPAFSSELAVHAASVLTDNLVDLDVILPRLPEDTRRSIVTNLYQTALHIRDGLAFVAASVALARRLPPEHGREARALAVELALANDDPTERALACTLASCSKDLVENTASELRSEALASVATIKERDRALAMRCAIALAPRTTREQAQETYAAVTTATHLDDNESALMMTFLSFAAALSIEERRQLVQTLRDKLGNLKDNDAAVIISTFLSLLPIIGPDEAQFFADHAVAVSKDDSTPATSRAFALLSPHILPASDVLENVSEIERLDERRIMNALFAPYLTGASALKLIDGMFEPPSSLTRPEALSAISLAEGGWFDLLGIYPKLSNGNPSRSYLEEIGGPSAVVETFQAIQDVRAWWP